MYQAYADDSTLHSIAFTACCVFQVLLLQKPRVKSKSKEHVACLERHLLLWHNSDIPALLNEGKCIQDHLQSAIQSETKPRNNVRVVDRLMSLGKVSAALKILSEDTNFLFEQLTGDLIKWAALCTHGAAGPSGVDAYAWRRLCSSFGSASMALCNSLAAIARRLCTQDVDSVELMAFVACRLIPLDKKPRVRPIGVGDVPRRIIAKAILHVIGDDIQLAAGALQTCAGHDAVLEAAIHAMKSIFDDDDTQAALLVDATIAFYLVNRQVALHSISVLCPSFSTTLKTLMALPSDFHH